MTDKAQDHGGMSDWTAHDGKSNSSEQFLLLVEEVARIIRQSASTLLSGDTESVARLIVAKLAHTHDLMPADNMREHLESLYTVVKELTYWVSVPGGWGQEPSATARQRLVATAEALLPEEEE